MTSDTEYEPVFADILPEEIVEIEETEEIEDIEENNQPEQTNAPEETIILPDAPSGPTIGSYFRGALGAFLGAAIGAIPWFVVSTFFGFFVGWLGFLVGVASFFGYKLLRGARNRVFAIVVVLLCSVFAICVAEFLGYYFQTWDYIVDYAQQMGYSLSDFNLFALIIECASMTLTLMFSKDMMGEVLGNLGIGLVIGGLGLISVRKYVSAYVSNHSTMAAPEAAEVVQDEKEQSGNTIPVEFIDTEIDVSVDFVASPVETDTSVDATEPTPETVTPVL